MDLYSGISNEAKDDCRRKLRPVAAACSHVRRFLDRAGNGWMNIRCPPHPPISLFSMSSGDASC